MKKIFSKNEFLNPLCLEVLVGIAKHEVSRGLLTHRIMFCYVGLEIYPACSEVIRPRKR